VDDLCDTRDTLGVGVGERLHDWRIHSCPAGHRNRCGVDQNNPGTKTVVTVGIKERRAGARREGNEEAYVLFTKPSGLGKKFLKEV